MRLVLNFTFSRDRVLYVSASGHRSTKTPLHFVIFHSDLHTSESLEVKGRKNKAAVNRVCGLEVTWYGGLRYDIALDAEIGLISLRTVGS